ncbi:MAG: hypothetical protein ACJ8GN_16370 [Longimicrobiaceae bacterium]
MTTLAHPRTDGHGRPRDSRALLERAIADAPSHVPPPAGWLRRLFARGRAAAALVRRYRLQPAIEHAYDRVTREMGPVRVEISAEDDLERPYVLMECITAPGREPSLDFQSAVRTEADALLRPEDRIRLSVFVRTESLDTATADAVRS